MIPNEVCLHHEADLQAAESQTREQTRVSCPYGHPWRTRNPESPSAQGAGPPRRRDRLEVAHSVGAGRPGERDPGSDLRFSRAMRIRRGPEIRELFRRGKRGRTSYLDVFISASPVSFPRLGVVVPRHRHSIVERNRLRRRIREIGRTELLPMLREAGVTLDLLVRARKEAYDAEFEGLRGELVRYTEVLCSAR